MSATDERRNVYAAAPTDWQKALGLAEKVSDPWFQCQALAEVARFAPVGEVVRIVERALKASRLAKDQYRRVAVGAWPLMALIARGKLYQARRVMAVQVEET